MPNPIDSHDSPRDVFAAHPESFGIELPIRGGWGYSIGDAVVIDWDDPSVDKAQRFDGIGVEYAFIEKRIHAELVFFRPPGDTFVLIDKRLLRQQLKSLGSRYFDLFRFEITALSEGDWSTLKSATTAVRNDLR